MGEPITREEVLQFHDAAIQNDREWSVAAPSAAWVERLCDSWLALQQKLQAAEALASAVLTMRRIAGDYGTITFPDDPKIGPFYLGIHAADYDRAKALAQVLATADAPAGSVERSCECGHPKSVHDYADASRDDYPYCKECGLVVHRFKAPDAQEAKPQCPNCNAALGVSTGSSTHACSSGSTGKTP